MTAPINPELDRRPKCPTCGNLTEREGELCKNCQNSTNQGNRSNNN